MTLTDIVKRLQLAHPTHAPVTFQEELQKVTTVFGTAAEFAAHYKRVDCDFVFDKLSHLFFIGTSGRHVDLMAALYRYYSGTQGPVHEDADQFILSSLGMLKSRAGHRILKSYAFSPPPELLAFRRDFEVLT